MKYSGLLKALYSLIPTFSREHPATLQLTSAHHTVWIHKGERTGAM